MRLISEFVCLIVLLTIANSARSFTKIKPRVLVFSKTAGFRHASIVNGKKALMEMGLQKGFEVDTTEDANWFTEERLKRYAAVVFLSTTGNVLDTSQQADFERYVQAGGGFLGIHAASDTEYGWPWFGKLVGAYFTSHPKIQTATLEVVDQNNLSTHHLPAEWKRTDEWYNFKELQADLHELILLNEQSYTGGTNGNHHPIAWYHSFDGGRSFYTGLGHTPESWTEENFLQHLWGGLSYSIGQNKKLDYKKATTTRVAVPE